YRSTGHAMQQGEMRPYGALVTYWHHQAASGRMEVRNAEGEVVYSQTLQARPGLNRVNWDLRPGGDADPERFPRLGSVAPGTYQVSVALDGGADMTELEVRGDPRRPVSAEAIAARDEALREAARLGRAVEDAETRLRDALEAVAAVLETLPEDSEGLRTQGTALQETLAQALRDLVTGPECQGICGGETPADRVRSLRRTMERLPGAPGDNDRLRLAQARTAAYTLVGDVDDLMSGPVASYREALRQAGYTPFRDPGGSGGDR
ncbi:MAG TPA: hypothetical protein VLA43_16700, partial [Longimicrobiales bacterium]|nr:hypothetical protein [Longimicrobiales bacterium]